MISLDCLKGFQLTENPRLPNLEKIGKKMALNSYLGVSLCHNDVFSVSSGRLQCISYTHSFLCFNICVFYFYIY